METTGLGLTALVALMHLYFLFLEMFAWQKPLGRRAFGLSAEHARITATLAANQGLYNGFLAAGLLWSLWLTYVDQAPLALAAPAIRAFFLGCVIVAGIYGAATASRRILWIQAAPAALALILLVLSR